MNNYLLLKILQKAIVPRRGGVEDTRLEAKAKDTEKIRGQGQGQLFRGRPSRGQGKERSRPRTKDTGASVFQKQIFFRRSPKKKVFKKFFTNARVT